MTIDGEMSFPSFDSHYPAKFTQTWKNLMRNNTLNSENADPIRERAKKFSINPNALKEKTNEFNALCNDKTV